VTKAQTEALEEVRRILNLHFDAWICAVRASEDGQNDEYDYAVHAPITEGIGMARMVQMKLESKL
jgi:hypothetical protein